MPLKCSNPLILGSAILIFQVIQLFGSDTLANPDCQIIMAKGQTYYTWRKSTANKSLGYGYGHFSFGKVPFMEKKNYIFIITEIIEQFPGQGTYSGILL